MKRTLLLCLGLTAAAGLLALALAPVQAQQGPAEKIGKIHGTVINPTGQPQGGGTVSLSTDGGTTLKYTFPVSDTGDYTGEAPQGTYMVIFRAADTAPGKMIDFFRDVKIVAGQDTAQNIDMSRQEYIDKMTPEEKKQLEAIKKANAAALKANLIVHQLNADLKLVGQDSTDIQGAQAAAVQALGAGASKADIEAKANEIRTAKYTDIESLMTKDIGLKPDEALLWVELGFAQAGLKKYDDAVVTYQKTIDMETASKTPRPFVLGLAYAGLGEIYARMGKVPEANAAYDAAAKANPATAAFNLKNEAVIFYQENNGAASAAAADEAIKINPNDALPYYIKGQGLVQNATVDPKTNRIVLPPDCIAAYEKYLELAPNGPYANDVAGILQQAGEKVTTSYKSPKSK